MISEIIRTENLTEQQEQALFGWSPDPFQSAGQGLCWRSKDFHLVLLLDGEPASHVGLLRDTILVAGESLAVAGFGGVITVPSYQGRGLALQCLAEAQAIVSREWGMNYGMLFTFPRLVDFYGKLGWVVWESPVWVDQPEGSLVIPRTTMVHSWNGGRWPEGVTKVTGLPW